MWQQDDGKRHMRGHLDDAGNPTGTWHWRQQDIDAIEDQLPAEAKAIRVFLRAQYAAEYDRVNAVYQRENGVALPRVKNYAPIAVDSVLGGKADQFVDPFSGQAADSRGVSPGALKTRSTSAVAKPKIIDALQAYLAHVRQMEHYIAYAGFAADASAVLNHRDTRDAIKAASGEEAATLLGQWVNLLANGGTADANAQLGLTQLLGRMNGRAAAMALTGRISVLAVQSVQLGAALAEIPAASYLKRFAKLMTGQLGWRTAIHSDYIQRRLSAMPPAVRQAMDGLASEKPSWLKHAAQRMGETINGADGLFTAGTYAILLDYHLGQAAKLGLTGDTATAYAHDAAARATDRVAQPTRAGTRSIYENTATNPTARLLWNFASEARQKLALCTIGTSGKSAGEKARAIAVTWGIGGVLTTLIRAALRDMRDNRDDELFDERNWNPARLALEALTGPLQGMPFLGDEISAAIAAIVGQDYRQQESILHSIAIGAQAAGHIDEWLDGTRDADAIVRDIEGMLTAGGMFSPNLSAAAGFSHLARDVYRLGHNFLN